MSTLSSGKALLSGRLAVVTGAVGSIGAAVARGFASHGADVVVADIDSKFSSDLARTISDETGVKTLGIGMNVSDQSAVEDAIDHIQSELGTPTIVAVNAGVFVSEPAVSTASETWERLMAVNLTGAFFTARAFAKHMVAAQTGGSIIFTSSLFGLRGGRGNGAYSATKFGVIGLAQSMAAELGENGIRVNAVCPGQIDSPMLGSVFEARATESGRDSETERSLFESKIPLGRLGSPEDVANGFVYLASDLSSYVTGHSLLIDGGWQVG